MASLFVYLPRVTLDYLKRRIPSIDSVSNGINQEELDMIDYLNIKDVDVMYLRYFRNLRTLVIDSFPGIDDGSFVYISRNCPRITTLVIKNQPNLTKIDLTRFSNLKNVSIISNEKLTSVIGLEGNSKFINQLEKIEFYDNVSYRHEDELIKNITRTERKRVVELDAQYFIDANNEVENFTKNYSNYEWHEKIGFRNQKDMTYSSGEMEVAYNYASAIVDTLIKSGDSQEMKVFVLYTWVLKNIKIEEDRIRNLNEGIVNVFKYRVSSIPTIAKYFQFLLRVAGIESFDINVFPRIQFNINKFGSFRIPSNDYAIIKIPTNKGNYYFDIAWDNDIYKKTGRLSTIFMYNGLEDILYNHVLIYDKLENPTESMPFERREELSENARKRIKNAEKKKLNVDIDEISLPEDITAYHSVMQENMKKYNESTSKIRAKRVALEKKLRDGKDNVGTKNAIRCLDKMIDAINASNAVLRNNIFDLEKSLLNVIDQTDLSYVEDCLGEEISPFKRKRIMGDNYVRVTKTKADLDNELNRIRNALNRDVSNRRISMKKYRTLKDKIIKVYTYLITFAYEKSIVMDKNFEGSIA